ncbi:unnamed protein product [Coffea canephora]|uniref:Uncharacterized protein n=1 Tax=Coffea canephora TaxID=49390 RepID=A0A068TPI2_COFCA|nr:unnamed protein product [Coffea canephora]
MKEEVERNLQSEELIHFTRKEFVQINNQQPIECRGSPYQLTSVQRYWYLTADMTWTKFVIDSVY